nr:carbohydrate porin [Thermoleptolyngbya sp. C42_A2020_037]
MAWILTSLLKSILLNSRSTSSSALIWLGLGLVLANTATASASDVPDQPPSDSNFLAQSATPEIPTDSASGGVAPESVTVSKNLSEALRPAIAQQNPPTAPIASNADSNTDSSNPEMTRAIAAAESAAAHAAGASINPNGFIRIGAAVEPDPPASASTISPAAPSTLFSGLPGAIAGSSTPFTFYPVTPGAPVGGTAAIPPMPVQMTGQMPGLVPGTPGSPLPTAYGTPQSGMAGALPQGQSPSSSAPFVFYMPAQPGYPVQPVPSAGNGFSNGLGNMAGGPATYPATVIGYLPNGTPVPVIVQMPIAGYGYPSGSAIGYANPYAPVSTPRQTFPGQTFPGQAFPGQTFPGQAFNPNAGFVFQPPMPQGTALSMPGGMPGYGYGSQPQTSPMGLTPGVVPNLPGYGMAPGYAAPYSAPGSLATAQPSYGYQGYGYGGANTGGMSANVPALPMGVLGAAMPYQMPGWPVPNRQPAAVPTIPPLEFAPLSVPAAPSRTGNPSTPLPPPPYQSQTVPAGGAAPISPVLAQTLPPTFVPNIQPIQPAPLPTQNPGFGFEQPGFQQPGIQTIPVAPPGAANQLAPVPTAPVLGQPFPATTGQESLPGRREALTQPVLQFQAGAIYQADEFSARGRLSGIYPFSPNFLVGGSLDLATGEAFTDDDGLNLNELYIAASLPDIPSLRLIAGQMDLTSYFDRNSFAKDSLTHFFNPVFQTNPALAAAAIGSRPGILLNWSITDNLEAKVATFSSDRSIDDFALNAFAGEIGFRVGNLILRGTYTSSIDGGKNDGFRESGIAPRGDGTFGIDSDDQESAYGVNAELFIPELNLGLFGRYGQYYNRDLDESGDTYSFGFNLFDLFRDGDRLGLGYGQALSNAGLRQSAGARRPDVLEVFYDLPVARNIRMGFTFQQLNEFSESIAGVRLRADFDVLPRGSF